MGNAQDNNSNYQQGFNEGYLITKHLPELSNDLAKIKSETPRMEGFRDGREQLILDRSHEREPEWLKTFSDNTKEKTHTPRKDDKDIDLDR